MRTLLILAFSFAISCASTSDSDCVQFNDSIPSFSDHEIDLIKKYMPQMVELNPQSILSHYLSMIKKTKEGYVFYFASLEVLRSHQCIESGLSTMHMDGGDFFVIDLVSGTLTWNPEESKHRPIQVKLNNNKSK